MTAPPGDGTPASPFPDGFFDRADAAPDTEFYDSPRLVTHIDDGAVEAVGALYAELELGPRVLDLASSWVSHFATPPDHLTVLGLNAAELAANPAARERVVADLNEDPRLPFTDASFDDAVCAVSVDYLTRPVEVCAEVVRVLRPGGRFVCTWSNRCFPTKVVRGWLMASDDERSQIVQAYLSLAGFRDVRAATRIAPGGAGDPLWACWGTTG